MSSETIIEQAYKLQVGRKRTRITTYENLIIHTTHPLDESKPKKRKPSIPSKYAEFNYYLRQRERSRKVKELAYNNFDSQTAVVVTLTFDRDMICLEEAHKHFNKFIRRVNDHYDDFRYLATFSRQGNGNWHYHMMTNFPKKIKNETIASLWKNGMTYVSDLREKELFEVSINYIVSNMKECEGELRGKHGYLSSRNLEKDMVVTSYKEEDVEKFNEMFSKILKSNNKILYETKNHLGIKSTEVDEETGEIKNAYVLGEELDDFMERAGYESWDTIYTHLTSTARFEDHFAEMKTAKLKDKKYKRIEMD